MICQFKCFKCKQVGEFDTDNSMMELLENLRAEPHDVYLVNCKNCGAENRVEVKRGNN